MRLGQRSISVLGTRTYPWNDPLHSASSALDQAIGRLDNRKCDICGIVGAESHDEHSRKRMTPEEWKAWWSKYETIQVGEHTFVRRQIH